MSTDGEQLAALAAWHVKDPDRMVALAFTPEQAWLTLAMLQLALRHPTCPAGARAAAFEVSHRLIDIIAPEDGPLRDLALRGFNPEEDR